MVSVNTNTKTLNGLVQGNFDGANVSSLSSNTLNVSSLSSLANVTAQSFKCSGNSTVSTLTSSGNISAGSITTSGNVSVGTLTSAGNILSGSLTSSGPLIAGTSQLGSVNGNVFYVNNPSVVFPYPFGSSQTNGNWYINSSFNPSNSWKLFDASNNTFIQTGFNLWSYASPYAYLGTNSVTDMSGNTIKGEWVSISNSTSMFQLNNITMMTFDPGNLTYIKVKQWYVFGSQDNVNFFQMANQTQPVSTPITPISMNITNTTPIKAIKILVTLIRPGDDWLAWNEIILSINGVSSYLSSNINCSTDTLINGQMTASKTWVNGALLSDIQSNIGIFQGLRNTNDWRVKFVSPGTTEKPSLDFSTTSSAFVGRIEHDYNVNAINFYTSGTKALTLDSLQNATISNTLSAPTVNSSILNGTLGTASQPNITSIGTLGNLAVTNSTTTGTITSSGIICASLSSSGSVLVNVLTASGLVSVYSLVSGPIICSSLTSSGAINVNSVGCVSLTTSGLINYGNSQLNGSLTAYQIQSNSTITSSGLLTCPNAQVNGSLTSSGAVTCNLNVSNISDQTYPISFPVFTGPNTSNWSCYASSANPSGTAYYSASTSTNSWSPNSFSADSSGNYHGSSTTTDSAGTWTGDYLTYNLSTDSFVLTGLTMYLWNNTTQMVVTVSPDGSTWTNLGVFNIPYVTDNNFINLSFPNNSNISNYTRLIFTKANSSPNIVSQVKLTCRGVASRMNSAGNVNCRSATILGSLTSSGAISTSSTITANGNINTVSGNLLISGTPVLNSTTIGSQIINSGLQNTSNSSFQIGSLFSLLGKLNNIKIDYGTNSAGTTTGSQTMNITFSSAPVVLGQLVSSNTANAYIVTIYSVSTTSFSYSKKYVGMTGGASNSVSESFYWIAIGT